MINQLLILISKNEALRFAFFFNVNFYKYELDSFLAPLQNYFYRHPFFGGGVGAT